MSNRLNNIVIFFCWYIFITSPQDNWKSFTWLVLFSLFNSKNFLNRFISIDPFEYIFFIIASFCFWFYHFVECFLSLFKAWRQRCSSMACNCRKRFIWPRFYCSCTSINNLYFTSFFNINIYITICYIDFKNLNHAFITMKIDLNILNDL